MSHAPERKEKNCLNCGAIVQGRYCHVCGQENIVPKENFFHLGQHFFYDITHFDSKFFDTVKYLFTRPGFLSKEYNKGRRASYLNPVRMYVFTSAIFFIIFFALPGVKNIDKAASTGIDNGINKTVFSHQQRDSVLKAVRLDLAEDSTNVSLKKLAALLEDTSRAITPADIIRRGDSSSEGAYSSVSRYDSMQGSLSVDKRDGFLKRLVIRRFVNFGQMMMKGSDADRERMVEVIFHKLPYVLFVSLPFFALWLKLLYIRRKQFYYADHAIFTIHHYILSFILLLLIFLFNWLGGSTGWKLWSYLSGITVFVWPVYLYLEMKRFYGQGRFKTFMKFFLLGAMGTISLTLIFVLFIILSVFQF
jgi:hypothetical protein